MYDQISIPRATGWSEATTLRDGTSDGVIEGDGAGAGECSGQPARRGRPPAPRAMEGQLNSVFEDLGIYPAIGQQFFRNIPPCLARIRLEVCTLARTRSIARQQSCLAGLAMQCQWLAGFARMAKFQALGQVAETLDGLLNELIDRCERLGESTIRTIARSVDLMNTLASSSPSKVGRAEGARVVLVDKEGNSRIPTLAAFERSQIAAIGMASLEPLIDLLQSNSVDVVIVRANSASSAAKLCQSIRALPRQAGTALVVLAPKKGWETASLLAINGASEVIEDAISGAELALKVLVHFFRGRMFGLQE